MGSVKKNVAEMRFPELVGLRAYLSLWVVFGHAIAFVPERATFGLRWAANPGYAVQSFMILSGFVIAHLLLGKRERYDVYIVRRAMRLLPIFIVTLIAGWLTFGMLTHSSVSLPWAHEPAFAPFVEKSVRRFAFMQERPLAHILAHATMLHGIIPPAVLPDAAGTILSPGWSISLEWQFYLIAPLVMWLFGRPWGWPVIFGGIFAGLIVAKLGHMDPAFLGRSSMFLVFGVIGRVALPKLAELDFSARIAAIVLISATLLFAKDPLNFLPSAAIYPYLIASARGENPIEFRSILANRVVLFLGEISYSIYLVHYVVFSVAAEFAVSNIVQLTPWKMLAVLFASVPLTIAISAVTYYTFERQGIALGRLWARRVAASTSRNRLPSLTPTQ